jgi:hypothetical protein
MTGNHNKDKLIACCELSITKYRQSPRFIFQRMMKVAKGKKAKETPIQANSTPKSNPILE